MQDLKQFLFTKTYSLILGLAWMAVATTIPVCAQQVMGNVSCTDRGTPLPGVTVLATEFLGGMQTAVTDVDGNYSMSLATGFYKIALNNPPTGTTYVTPASGFYEQPFAPGVNLTANFVLAGCGSAPAGELGDRVWNDLNCNGIQDFGEPGMAEVSVELADCEGLVLTQTTTDEDGYYLFESLAPADYVIHVVAPPGFEFSPANQGDDPCADSDVDPVTGETACISLEEDQVNLCLDAGLCQLEAPGVRSQGYWKNHPDQWPVEEIEIGDMVYHKWDAILMMQLPIKGNKWLNMFQQLVAAELNVFAGNESDCIEDTLLDANLWLEFNPSPVRANSAAWKKEGRYLHSHLGDYNNGHLCAPYADSF